MYGKKRTCMVWYGMVWYWYQHGLVIIVYNGHLLFVLTISDEYYTLGIYS